MTLLIFLGVSVLIGAAAQMSKGRTGAAWGFMTLLVCCFLWVLGYFGAALGGMGPAKIISDGVLLALAVISAGIAAAIMGLIVLTFPKARRS